MKKLLSILLVLVMLVSMMAGCSKAETPTNEPAKDNTPVKDAPNDSADPATNETEQQVTWDTTKKDTIIVSVINNFYTAGEKALAEAYMKMHPETEVVVDVIADNGTYIQKLLTTADGEYAPDIVHANFYANSALGTNYQTVIERGLLYDCTQLLDEVNPYNDGKLVREAFNDGEVEYMLAQENGILGYLPLDRIGIGLYYNKDILDSLNIAVPTSIEELVWACEKLEAAGYEQPLGTAVEAESLANIIADAAYRYMQGDFLTVEGDATYNPETMSQDNGFEFDENNYNCDNFTYLNTERLLGYLNENGVDTPINRGVWEVYFSMAQFFPYNFLSEDSTTTLTNFETQKTPLLYMPSYTVGNINADILQLPEDMQFAWGTSQLKTIGESLRPEGFSNNLRALWVYGNIMGIVTNSTTTDDHLERVKDFMKFWYSPEGASLCFKETLEAGNYIQGPCIIKGVDLGEELNAYIAGFETTPFKDMGRLLSTYTGSENGVKRANARMDCAAGKITLDEYLQIMQEVVDDSIPKICEKNGYDLDPTTPNTPKQ